MKTIKIILACSVTLMFFVSMVAAQEPTVKVPPTIRTSGDAVVLAKPDRAQIDVGVVTQAATSQAAVEQNSRQLETLLSALKKLLGENADIRTTNYSLMPNTRYVTPPPAEPTITSYTATNIVRVVLDDLTQLGKVIDTAGGAGANRIQSLQFTVKNQQTVQAQAIIEAVSNARRKADLIATSMGLKIVRVVSVSETTPIVSSGQSVAYQSFSGGGADMASIPSTPIAPRTIEVRAVVLLAVEVSP
jgi:uncharacterized protein